MLTWFNARIWALCAGDRRTHVHIHMRAYMHTHSYIHTYAHTHRQNNRYFAGSNFGYTYFEYSRWGNIVYIRYVHIQQAQVCDIVYVLFTDKIWIYPSFIFSLFLNYTQTSYGTPNIPLSAIPELQGISISSIPMRLFPCAHNSAI